MFSTAISFKVLKEQVPLARESQEKNHNFIEMDFGYLG